MSIDFDLEKKKRKAALDAKKGKNGKKQSTEKIVKKMEEYDDFDDKNSGISFTCVRGQHLKFLNKYKYVCYEHMLIHLTQTKVVFYQSFKAVKNLVNPIPKPKNFIRRFLESDLNVEKKKFLKIDIEKSQKLRINFDDLKRCSNIVTYLHFFVTICEEAGKFRIEFHDITKYNM
jgi:hypothetical protein